MKEVAGMIDLFSKHQPLKDVPIFPVRGNRDIADPDGGAGTFDFLPSDTQWHNELYYETHFQISSDSDSKYMSMLHVDSNLLLCHVL